MKRTTLIGLSHVLMSAEVGAAGGTTEAAPATPATSSGTKIRPNTGDYKTVKTPNGSSTKICGDEVSLALVGATLDETYGFVSKVVGTPEAELRTKYGDKNLGQQRMFLGNLIRGASQSKDAEKKARVEAAFKQHLASFRENIDVRMKAESEAKQAQKDAKAKEKADAKAKADADKKAAAEKRAKEAAEKKAAAPAKAQPQATTSAAPAGAAKPAPTPASAAQAKAPAQPATAPTK